MDIVQEVDDDKAWLLSGNYEAAVDVDVAW